MTPARVVSAHRRGLIRYWRWLFGAGVLLLNVVLAYLLVSAMRGRAELAQTQQERAVLASSVDALRSQVTKLGAKPVVPPSTTITAQVGEPGPAGATGATGAAGAPGQAGTAGAAGGVGATGKTGAAGPAGKTGAPGPAGAKGETGATGPAGPQGVPGPIGLPGVTGAQGPAGPAGPAGAAGANGADGRTGSSGEPPAGWTWITTGGRIVRCARAEGFDPSAPSYVCRTLSAPTPDPTVTPSPAAS